MHFPPIHAVAGQAMVSHLTRVLRPKLTVTAPDFHFKDVQSGVVIKHIFKLKNEGSLPLKITSIKPLCGCTRVGDWGRVVFPGQAEKITVSLETTHLADAVYKTIQIESNDPEQPIFMVHLQGRVIAPFTFSSSQVQFGIVPENFTARVLKIEIRDNESKSQAFDIQTSPAAFFKTLLIPLKAGNKFELQVTLDPPLKPGWNTGLIFLQHRNSNEGSLAIPVSAYRMQRVYLRPLLVSLPPGPLITRVRKTIYVFFTTSLDFAVKELKITDPDVVLSVKEEVSKKRYCIDLDFPKGWCAFKNRKYQLMITTNDPDCLAFQVLIVQAKAIQLAGKTQP
jgi:hypothetical protein